MSDNNNCAPYTDITAEVQALTDGSILNLPPVGWDYCGACSRWLYLRNIAATCWAPASARLRSVWSKAHRHLHCRSDSHGLLIHSCCARLFMVC